jgi:hypothetical protein
LAAIENGRRTVVGFVGMSGAAAHGLCLDRGNWLDWPATENATSIDELAVILHRDTELQIDPALGWHLWATDMCLQAERATIIRVPVHHNSHPVPEHISYTVPPAFHESAKVLRAKYPGIPIRTLCGEIA